MMLLGWEQRTIKDSQAEAKKSGGIEKDRRNKPSILTAPSNQV
jgi:hypothetical protein